jgi:hypothetical protein
MKKLLLGVAIVFAAVDQAPADTIEIGVQYTLNQGFNIQWTGYNNTGYCGSPDQGGHNCAAIPPGKTLRECSGTQTIKIGGVELLARIVAGTTTNFETIWQGHHLSSEPTIPVRSPVLSQNDTQTRGNGINMVWVDFQAGNAGPSSAPGGGWEMQVTCSTY